jgi:hypothetical protein
LAPVSAAVAVVAEEVVAPFLAAVVAAVAVVVAEVVVAGAVSVWDPLSSNKQVRRKSAHR